MSSRLMAGVAVFVALSIWLLARPKADREPIAEEVNARQVEAPEPPPVEPERPAPSTPPQAMAAPPGVVHVEKADLIESVRFEPEAPCRGDDVLVRTILTDSARGAKVFVDGEPGSPQVILAKNVGAQRVRILARSWGDAYERREISLDVRDCGEAPESRATIQIRAVSDHRYVLSLVRDRHEPPLESSSVHWELGDGATKTGNPIVHQYRARSDEPQSTYLVVVRYQTETGTRVVSAAVSHAEPLAIAARTAFPVLGNRGERFVDWNPERGLRATRHIDNTLDTPIELTHAELRGFPCDSSPVQVRSVPLEAISRSVTVAPGDSIEVPIDVPPTLFDKPVCQMLVRLGGDADGRIATTAFALETGVPEARYPVDESMHAAIRAIARRKGYDAPITAEDIELYHLALRDEG